MCEFDDDGGKPLILLTDDERIFVFLLTSGYVNFAINRLSAPRRLSKTFCYYVPMAAVPFLLFVVLILTICIM